jgi:hypothetical protein
MVDDLLDAVRVDDVELAVREELVAAPGERACAGVGEQLPLETVRGDDGDERRPREVLSRRAC